MSTLARLVDEKASLYVNTASITIAGRPAAYPGIGPSSVGWEKRRR